MGSKTWWRAAGIRAIKTMAQTAIAMIGTCVVLSEVDWKVVASAAVLSGILSLLTSVAGLPEVDLLEGAELTMDDIEEEDDGGADDNC